jgi:hypothetical protein
MLIMSKHICNMRCLCGKNVKTLDVHKKKGKCSVFTGETMKIYRPQKCICKTHITPTGQLKDMGENIHDCVVVLFNTNITTGKTRCKCGLYMSPTERIPHVKHGICAAVSEDKKILVRWRKCGLCMTMFGSLTSYNSHKCQIAKMPRLSEIATTLLKGIDITAS